METVKRKLCEELEKELDAEIEWRIYEVSLLKITPYMKSVNDNAREILQKYSVPAFYSLWEGFVSKGFEIYINKINALSITKEDIHPNILTHDLDMKIGIKDSRTDLKKQVELTLYLKEHFEAALNISCKVPTKSNVNCNTINNILKRFNLTEFDKKNFYYGMSRLLKYRNNVAHGENSLLVDNNIVKELSEVTTNCMYELRDILVDGYKKETYLK